MVDGKVATALQLDTPFENLPKLSYALPVEEDKPAAHFCFARLSLRGKHSKQCP